MPDSGSASIPSESVGNQQPPARVAPNDMIKVYGNSTCSDCIRSKRFLTAHGIDFEYVDVERDPDAEEFVVRVNAGRESIIPTLVFPDGSTMTEPTDAELAAKLGIPIGPQR